MDIKELIAQFDDMESENGMNIQEAEEVNEAKIENGTFNDKDVMFDKISHVGIVCRPADYDTEKVISFSFVSDPQHSKSFRAPKDNETDPEMIANICAEILRKHLDPAEDEILALLQEKGYELM